MAENKCRNCDAPLKGARFCPECGADSQAKKFDRNDDVLAENKRLKEELESKKDWIPRPATPEGQDDADDIG